MAALQSQHLKKKIQIPNLLNSELQHSCQKIELQLYLSVGLYMRQNYQKHHELLRKHDLVFLRSSLPLTG